MDKETKDKIIEIEKRLKKFESLKRRLDKIEKVLDDFWDSEKNCDDIDALSRIIKIMKSYNG